MERIEPWQRKPLLASIEAITTNHTEEIVREFSFDKHWKHGCYKGEGLRARQKN